MDKHNPVTVSLNAVVLFFRMIIILSLKSYQSYRYPLLFFNTLLIFTVFLAVFWLHVHHTCFQFGLQSSSFH